MNTKLVSLITDSIEYGAGDKYDIFSYVNQYMNVSLDEIELALNTIYTS